MRATATAQQSPESADSYVLTSTDFERVRRLIYRYAGISLSPSKQTMVYSRLSRRLRALRLPDFRSYLDALEAQPAGRGEWQEFVNALTTNLTSFYRESHHFPILAEHIAHRATKGKVSIWCCAASTGEEPYTLAITAMQACDSSRPPVSILATDIDTSVLAKAREGVYGDEAVAKIDAGLLKKYFLRGHGANAGMVRVRRDLQALVDFQPLNLLDAQWPMDTQFDAIFCRNVMIYFDKDTQRRVLLQLARHLKPDGLLFAGHSENFSHVSDVLKLRGHTVYELTSATSGRRKSH
jgi:chemotaxis protein methyltransferase CheR